MKRGDSSFSEVEDFLSLVVVALCCCYEEVGSNFFNDTCGINLMTALIRDNGAAQQQQASAVLLNHSRVGERVVTKTRRMTVDSYSTVNRGLEHGVLF